LSLFSPIGILTARSLAHLQAECGRGQIMVMADTKCSFCDLNAARIYAENDVALALPDAYPIAEGHTLVVPKRHVASIFDLSDEEQAALWKLVAQVRAKLWHDLACDGFNVGVNDGQAAGQTVPHAHVHVIPRRKGDSPDPRGGVRWIKPEKAKYWGEGEK
jgi:diadenosine tetraphosphate (Ap4A) HIT family hydrolase